MRLNMLKHLNHVQSRRIYSKWLQTAHPDCTGFPYSNEVYRRLNIGNVTNLLGSCMGVRRGGSAALDLCFVAAGRLDAFWELGLKPWDTAAGVLIVSEAGGKVTDFHGEPFNIHGGNIVVSNGNIHSDE